MGAPSRTSPRRVLVAEDDQDLRELIVEVLCKDGAIAHGVADAPSLRTSLISTGEVFDLIVSDVRLPGGSGLIVLEDLRAVVRMTPVIVISAFSDVAVADRARSLGANLLDKPFTLDDFRALVGQLLGR